MTDLLLRFDPVARRGDFVLADGALATDDSLRSAIVISLFTDGQARTDDSLLPDNGDRRGWWGDVGNADPHDRIGSRLWLLERRKLTKTDALFARDAARDALAWLVEDGIASALDVEVELVPAGARGDGGMRIGIDVTRPSSRERKRFDFVWDATARYIDPEDPLPLPQGSTYAAFIAPAGTGDMSGRDVLNAAPLSAINAMVARAAQLGGDVAILADQGDYAQNGSLTISAGGLPGRPVAIRGVNAALSPEMAQIVGTRNFPYDPATTTEAAVSAGVSGANAGLEVFRLMDGADYLSFEWLTFRNQGRGCIRVAAPVTALSIGKVKAFNVNTFLENRLSPTSPSTHASIDGLSVRDVEVRGYSKRGFMVRYDSRNVVMQDVLCDSERQDGDNFASGFVLYDTAHDITYIRCRADNNIDTLHAYQNADGFSGEEENHRITLIDCSAHGNTDGGIDLKGDDVRVVRFYSEGNHRNYRLWGYAELVDCVGIEPADNAGANPYPKCQIGAFLYAMVRVLGGRFEQSDAVTDPPLRAETGGILALSPETLIVKPAATALYLAEEAHNGDPAGQFTMIDVSDLDPPVITSSPAIALNENVLGRLPIATSKIAQLRIVGGRNRPAFSNLGNQLRIGRQDYEDPDFADHDRLVVVQMMDANANRSAVQEVTVTIVDVADDAIGPDELFGSGGATDGVWFDVSRADTLWADTAGTVPAQPGDPVARMDDLSGLGHHATQSVESFRPIYMLEGGRAWLEFDGLDDRMVIGAANALRFNYVTAVVTHRRAAYDVDTRTLLCVPRSATTASANAAWSIGVVGGASMNCNARSMAIGSAGAGASVGLDWTFTLRTETRAIRSNAVDRADLTDAGAMVYPAAATPTYLGCDGNVEKFMQGRFYNAVVTNRTEAEDIGFRIERQLAANIGVIL